MNVLKSKLQREQQLQKVQHGSPTRFTTTPRNLQDVASAHDLKPSNAPMNIYSESQMTRIMRESKEYKK